MEIDLYDYQLEAIDNLNNGSILCGGVGTGKSRTSLGYYFKECGGGLKPYSKMKNPKDLYIITTARKRDTHEWEKDMLPFRLSTSDNDIFKIKIDSWNNISKYINVTESFFIFDEQRVVGSGQWVKSFLKITKNNKWILLSATPGDTWMDYIPVFIANGFYKNKTEFIREHVVYSRFSKFPKVDRYINTGRLIRLRNKILVDMTFERLTIPHHVDVEVDYDISTYKKVMKERWNFEKEKPIENASELCYELRKVVNTDISRLLKLIDIIESKKKVIVFYNFDYELDLISNFLDESKIRYSQWNGHKHQPIIDTDENGNKLSRWVYLVQYTAGAEGWNCISTDTIIFYSQNYSYKIMMQSSGRIDRLNTPYRDLYYYHFKSKSSIDLAISRALHSKKKFNESRFVTF